MVRVIHPKKRGHIASDHPPICKRLKISPEEWTDLALNVEKHFNHKAGSDTELLQVCVNKVAPHVHGSAHCRQEYSAEKRPSNASSNYGVI